jgi:hypothetical protein
MSDNTNERATFDPATGRVTFPTTQLPCPDWCTLPAGHPFDNDLKDGTLCRYHEARVGRAEDRSRHDREPLVDFVRVVADEFATADDGPVVLTGDPHVEAGELAGDLTPHEARRMIAALTAAVDLCDRVVVTADAARPLRAVPDLPRATVRTRSASTSGFSWARWPGVS